MGRIARVIVVAIPACLLLASNHEDAAARTSRRNRLAPRSPGVESSSPVPSPDLPAPAVGEAVGCSCASTSRCPEIGRLDIRGYRAQPLYCNQLNGAENPGVHGNKAWYYQCAELANRWLVESVGAPRIEGNADQMCDNANRASFEVHTSKSAYTPVPGDLLVWSGYKMGHVGVVTAVSPSSLVFANQNYGHDGLQFPVLAAPRTAGFFGSPRSDAGLHAKCIIHPRKLGSPPSSPGATVPPEPCARVPSTQNGTYCGASRQSGFAGGDEGTLYTCHDGKTTSVRCSGSCTLEPVGHPDHCT